MLRGSLAYLPNGFCLLLVLLVFFSLFLLAFHSRRVVLMQRCLLGFVELIYCMFIVVVFALAFFWHLHTEGAFYFLVFMIVIVDLLC